MSQHTADIYNVNELDDVTLTLTGREVPAECSECETTRANPRTGEVRESTLWKFETPVGQLVVNIIQGLRSSPDDPDFPIHKQVWNMDAEKSMGYVEAVKIHGPPVEQ